MLKYVKIVEVVKMCSIFVKQLRQILTLKNKIMKTRKSILKINSDGFLVEFNNSLNRFELISRSWTWDDITPGYKRESKKNYNANK